MPVFAVRGVESRGVESAGVVGTTGERRRGPAPRPIAERLWSKVDKNGPTPPGMDAPCWVFTGCRAGGYGMISAGRHCGRMKKAHRVAWEDVNGPIPAGLEVCHKCDHPPCVNPAHLFLGTHSDNMRDAVAKGRLSQIYLSKNRGERNGRAKLNRASVATIRAADATARDLATAHGVSIETIHAIRQGRIWRDAA